jgi:hypothetical protein
MLLPRIAQEALVATTSGADDAGVSSDAAIMAVDRGHVALFAHDVATIEVLVPVFLLLARAAALADDEEENGKHEQRLNRPHWLLLAILSLEIISHA